MICLQSCHFSSWKSVWSYIHIQLLFKWMGFNWIMASS